MRRVALSILLLSAAPPIAAQSADKVVADRELSTMRGGFQIPGGIDVALSVQTDTSVNGALVLRSIFRADTGVPTLQAFTSRSGSQVSTANSAGGATVPAGAVSVRFDRQNGVTVVPGSVGVMPAVAISTGTGPAAAALTTDALAPGATADTQVGRVTLDQLQAGTRVHLQGESLDVSHVFGNAFGAVVANTASDRALDTVTTVSLDLSGATPTNLGSTMFRVEALGLESTRMLGR
jgi:hypothetical protein